MIFKTLKLAFQKLLPLLRLSKKEHKTTKTNKIHS